MKTFIVENPALNSYIITEGDKWKWTTNHGLSRWTSLFALPFFLLFVYLLGWMIYFAFTIGHIAGTAFMLFFAYFIFLICAAIYYAFRMGISSIKISFDGQGIKIKQPSGFYSGKIPFISTETKKAGKLKTIQYYKAPSLKDIFNYNTLFKNKFADKVAKTSGIKMEQLYRVRLVFEDGTMIKFGSMYHLGEFQKSVTEIDRFTKRRIGDFSLKEIKKLAKTINIPLKEVKLPIGDLAQNPDPEHFLHFSNFMESEFSQEQSAKIWTTRLGVNRFIMLAIISLFFTFLTIPSGALIYLLIYIFEGSKILFTIVLMMSIPWWLLYYTVFSKVRFQWIKVKVSYQNGSFAISYPGNFLFQIFLSPFNITKRNDTRLVRIEYEKAISERSVVNWATKKQTFEQTYKIYFVFQDRSKLKFPNYLNQRHGTSTVDRIIGQFLKSEIIKLGKFFGVPTKIVQSK